MWQYNYTGWLAHEGKGHLDGGHSGRYPWGSGKRPRQRSGSDSGMASDKFLLSAFKKKKKSTAQEARDMSDEELQKAVKRLSSEKVYIDTSKKLGRYSEGEKKLTLDAAKNAVAEADKLVGRMTRQVSDDIRNRPKIVQEDLSKLTEQELREKINRAMLEQQYAKYFGTPEVEKGEEAIMKALEVSGGVLSVGSAALAIALAVKQLIGD